MSELGKLLKQARLEKGITLEQLQDTTKIRKRYLEAIEEEDFKVLPGTFYARAFIKSYAEAVGLDSDELIQYYNHVIPSANTETRAEPIRRKPKARGMKSTDRLARLASTLLVLFFFALIFVIIYHFVLSNNDGSSKNIVDDSRLTDRVEDGNDTEQTPNPVDTVEPDPEPDTPPTPDPELAFVAKDGTTYIYTLSHSDHMKLELDMANGPCWVQIRKSGSNGEIIKEVSFKKGDKEELDIEDSLYIRLGYPLGVELSINGNPVNAEHLNSDSPVNFQFNLIQ